MEIFVVLLTCLLLFNISSVAFKNNGGLYEDGNFGLTLAKRKPCHQEQKVAQSAKRGRGASKKPWDCWLRKGRVGLGAKRSLGEELKCRRSQL